MESFKSHLGSGLSDGLGSNRTACLTWHHHGFLIGGPHKFDELFKFKFGQMGEIFKKASVGKFSL